ncbi:MAG TPA: flagellar M-ring protein FliF C-terminal domain-containing protein [Planctomycetota bacterium]|nr:flagellar M-ring protein FliF C-terminal domain-containing protein [Planctomycetota bacterium]
MDWLKGVLSQATAAFRAMTAAQRASMVMLGLTIAVALGLVAVLGASPKFVAVASGLDQNEMREAANVLDQGGVEYKADLQKGAILVPSDRQPAVAAMLRKSEVIDQNRIFNKEKYRESIGSSLWVSEAERDKQRRDALAGELRQMISGLDGVETCRVVITDDKPGEFNLSPERIGVSVTVTPRGAKKIDQAFANSVIDLVGSAVHNCDPGKITVIDTRNPGKQYHREDAETEVVLSNKRLALSREIEQHYQKKINELIASMHYEGVGIVTCREVNLDKVKRLVQTVKPDETVVVRQRTVKHESTGASAVGGPTGVPVNEPGLVISGGASGPSGTAGGTPSRSKDSETETSTICSFVTEEIQKAPGEIAKLTASVVINRRLMDRADKDGRISQVYDEEPNDELKAQWKALVAKILGIEDPKKVDESIALCFWKQPRENPVPVVEPKPELRDMVAGVWPYARIGGVLMLTAFAFLFLFVLGRRAATAPPPNLVVTATGAAGGSQAAAEEAGIEADDVKLRQLQDKLRGVVGQDPRKAATLIKRWLSHEG